MSEIKDIPKGWTIASLVNDLPYIKTGVPKYKGKKKYFSTGSIKSDSIIEEGEYSFSEKPSRANRLAIKGDVLQARMKATDKAILIDAKLDGQLFSTGFFQIRPIDGKLSSSYILHYLTSLKFTQIKDELCSGSTQSALNDEGAKKIFIPIPPFKEQQAIVAKIEELLSELENGKQQLLTAQQQLKVYRQSLLKWAFEGKLTNKNVKDGELPKGWSRKHLFELAKLINGDRGKNYPNRNEYVEKGLPFINTGHIEPNGKLDIDSMNYITRDKFDTLNSGKVKVGDLVYCLRGATMGKTAIIEQFEEGAIASSLVIVRLNKEANYKYIYYYLISPFGKDNIKEFDNGTAQPNLSAKSLSMYQIPTPNLKEQELIVSELESKLTVCDKIEETISQSLQQAETLRQSILKKAFEGKLI